MGCRVIERAGKKIPSTKFNFCSTAMNIKTWAFLLRKGLGRRFGICLENEKFPNIGNKFVQIHSVNTVYFLIPVLLGVYKHLSTYSL